MNAIVEQPLIWTNLSIDLDNGAQQQSFTNEGYHDHFVYNVSVFSAENLDEGVHSVVVMTEVPQEGAKGINWIFFDYITYS